MISLSQIQELFIEMHSKGMSTDKEMLYGYFFTDKKSDVLQEMAKVLEPHGFKFVDIRKDETDIFWLHLERIEVHTPESLHNLNSRFYKLAEEWKILSYDGFDLGNADPGKPIERDTHVVEEDYKVGDRIVNDIPELIILNVGFDKFLHKEEFRFLLKITSNYECGNDAMLPSQEELKSLDELEQFLETNLERNNVAA